MQFLYIWQYMQFYHHAEAACILKFYFSSPLLVFVNGVQNTQQYLWSFIRPVYGLFILLKEQFL